MKHTDDQMMSYQRREQRVGRLPLFGGERDKSVEHPVSLRRERMDQ